MKTTTPTGNSLENLYEIFDDMSGMSLKDKSLKAYRSIPKSAEQLEKLATQNADTIKLRLCGPMDVYLQELDLPGQNYIHNSQSRYMRVAFRRESKDNSPYINVSIRLSTGELQARSNKLIGTKYISGDYFLNGDASHASFDKLESDLTALGVLDTFKTIMEKVKARATGATSRNNLRKLVCD